MAAQMKILLVEDNQINREVARSFLEGDNHIVIEAHDGAEGVRLANWGGFDAILMDISMPEMDGIEATREIREGDGPSKDVPIIALTAHTQKEDVDSFLAAGMNAVVFKPVTRQAMRKMLNSLQRGVTSTEKPIRQKATQLDLVDHAIFFQFKRDLGADKMHTSLGKFIAEMDQEIGGPAVRKPYHYIRRLGRDSASVVWLGGVCLALQPCISF